MSEVSTTVEVGAEGETVPLMELLTGRGFITGKSGSGKSNTASVVAEEILDEGLPLIIVDTDGEYYGLKAEFEMLQIGPGRDCDVDIGPERANEIAELALVENVPIILDVSGFVEQEDAEHLIDAVLKQLFALENEWEKPFLVLVEELHEFVPEQQSMPHVGETIIRIAKRGRKRGLGLVGMSQRPAAVDKDYITQCNWLVWHRLTWNNDTQVVDRIMGGDAAETVQSLGDGEALVLTDWDDTTRRLQFRRKRTFDAGSTPTLSDADQPSLKTVDQSLISKLEGPEFKSTETSEGDDSGSEGLELFTEDNGDSEERTADTTSDRATQSDRDSESDRETVSDRDTLLHRGNNSVSETNSVRETGLDRDADSAEHTPWPGDSEGDGFLWELGQLVWYLLVQTGVGVRERVRRFVVRSSDTLGQATDRASGTDEARSRLRYTGTDDRFATENAGLVLLIIGLILLTVLGLLALTL